jgi:tetratricopeptide (TPR) repeat protein
MHFKSACGACQGRGYNPAAFPDPGMPQGAGGAMAGAAGGQMAAALSAEQQARMHAEKKMRQMEYYQKAMTLKAQGNYYDAGNWFKKAIDEGHEEQAECHNERGECLEEQGQLDNALTEFNQALRHKPREARFLYNRGKLYFKKGIPEARFGEKVKDFGRAEADLQQALTHIGGNHQLREKIQGRTAAIHTELTQMAAEATGRGQQLYGAQNWDGAFAAFSESLSTKQGNRSECLFLRAMCSIQRQQPE